MKGLLIKDFYVSLRTGWLYFVVTVVLGGIIAFGGARPFVFLPAAYLMMILPMTLLAIDERAKWNTYADTLPITRAQVVAEKYILTLILSAFSAAVLAVSALIAMINPMLGDERPDLSSFLSTLGCFPLELALTSVCIPFVFKFGFDKGRIAYMFACAMAGVGLGVFTSWNVNDLPNINIPSHIMLISSAASAAVFAASWAASTLLYKTREF